MLPLLALLALPISATLVTTGHLSPELVVTVNGRRIVSKAFNSDDGSGSPLKAEARIGTARLVAKDTSIVNETSGRSLDALAVFRKVLPNMPESYGNALTLRSKGAYPLGDRALWIFSWDDLDISLDPSAASFAIEVKVENGLPIAVRATSLAGLGEHPWPRIVRVGNRLAFAFDGISVLDLDSWKETVALKGGEGRIGRDGRLYWSKDGKLYTLDAANTQPRFLGMPDLGALEAVLNAGGEDVLAFSNGLYAPFSRATYRYPGPSNVGVLDVFFLVPPLGLGVCSDYWFAADTRGILLSAENLTPLAMIRRDLGRQP